MTSHSTKRGILLNIKTFTSKNLSYMTEFLWSWVLLTITPKNSSAQQQLYIEGSPSSPHHQSRSQEWAPTRDKAWMKWNENFTLSRFPVIPASHPGSFATDYKWRRPPHTYSSAMWKSFNPQDASRLRSQAREAAPLVFRHSYSYTGTWYRSKYQWSLKHQRRRGEINSLYRDD